MKFVVELTEKAEEEFDFGIEYYESKQAGLGQRFRKSVSDVLYFLEKNPFIFQKKYHDFREALAKPFPYLLVFEIIGKKVVVHSIFFCDRDPEHKYSSGKKT